jgi:hypothetical protein
MASGGNQLTEVCNLLRECNIANAVIFKLGIIRIDAIAPHRFELPALIALRRMAGTVRTVVRGARCC